MPSPPSTKLSSDRKQSPAPSDPGEHPIPPPSDSASTLRLRAPHLSPPSSDPEIPTRYSKFKSFPSDSGIQAPPSSLTLGSRLPPISLRPRYQIPALFPRTQRCRSSPPLSVPKVQTLPYSLRCKDPDPSLLPQTQESRFQLHPSLTQLFLF